MVLYYQPYTIHFSIKVYITSSLPPLSKFLIIEYTSLKYAITIKYPKISNINYGISSCNHHDGSHKFLFFIILFYSQS